MVISMYNDNDKISDFKSLDTSIQNKSEVTLTSNIAIGDGEASEYRDGIEINRDHVTIDGNGFSINGDGKSRAFLINAKEVTLKNIRFENCFNRGGGSIFVSQNAKLTISECEFYDNHADDAGAILNMGQLKIENCNFKENRG